MKEKIIKYEDLKNKIVKLILQTSYNLPDDIYDSLKENIKIEKSILGKIIIEKLIENADIARCEKMPLCQDTGIAVFMVEIGQNVKIEGGFIKDAIFEATKQAYEIGYLRKSMVIDPIFQRLNTKTNLPPIIHFDIIKDDKLIIKFAPKGAGAENMSKLKMFKPLEKEDAIIQFAIDTVVNAGGNPCPPIVLGMGIGGNFETSAFLAKKALFRKIGQRNENVEYSRLEEKIKERLNETGIGPQGLGGTITCLDVFIEYYPCHIASLPVAININCNSSRHGIIEI
ncbi:MAG: fumarate hydratase [Exilispira sp.]